jgi:hypothetical protein
MATMLSATEIAGMTRFIALTRLEDASLYLTKRIKALEALGRDDEVMQAVLAKNCVIKAIQALGKAVS